MEKVMIYGGWFAIMLGIIIKDKNVRSFMFFLSFFLFAVSRVIFK